MRFGIRRQTVNTLQEPMRVFVLTSRPLAFLKVLESMGMAGEFYGDIPRLIDAALEAENAVGMVLDVQTVMAANQRKRDHLFSLSSKTRILRARVEAATGHVFFLDDVSLFKRPLSHLAPFFRTHVRIPLEMPVTIGHEDDPAMASPQQAEMKDISLGGCFLHMHFELPHSDFLYLQMSALDNPLPVLCNIRWRRPVEGAPGRFGAGVKFIDIKPDQLSELQRRFIEQASAE